MEQRRRIPIGPLFLTLAIILADQASKALVVAFVAPGGIGFSAFGDFLYFLRQQNLGMAFSLLDELGTTARAWILIVLPAVLVSVIFLYYFLGQDLSALQRWALCGIAGGGVGNLIDRVFRPEGVVDFISIKFYGIFGYDRWPTFNIADSAVVVCTILFVIATIAVDARRKEQ
jgi:signal peptidase II